MRSVAWRAAAMIAVGALAGCAGSPRTTTGTPVPSAPAGMPAADTPRGHPGFDASTYPGDSAMQAWRATSPYRWVGYYLAAPCHRDASWSGTRARLEAQGWGFALLYVGQQSWEGAPDRDPSDSVAAGRPIICSRTLLTAAQGRADADDAIAKADAEGFTRGSAIFLDIERVSSVSAQMREYYRAWTRRLIQEGRFRPALYAHQRNAAEIHTDMRAIAADAGAMVSSSMTIPLWIAAPSAGFSVVQAPSELGFAAANVWQGSVDVTQAWGGVALRIDANVADSRSPSAPVVATGSR